MKQRGDGSPSIRVWLKRGVVYFLGLFIMALGVVFSVKSSLGVSPVTSLANVTHQITGIALGVCTTGTYCFYILVEVLILRKDFKAHMLLQILASFFFGLLVTAATELLGFIPAPGSYLLRLVYLFISIPLVSFGVMLYLAPAILPTPGEGLSLAVSTKTGKPVAVCKIITDCCMVALSALTSLLFFHALVGVREGTVISALTVGFLMKRMMRVCQAPLLRFVERETKLERAIRQEGLPEMGKGGLILTISRETGSDGLWVAEALSKALGIPFYDDEKLIPMEAEESGLSEDFIRAHEQTMGQNLLYDFLTSGYAMYNEDLPPLEKLFAAQCRVLRRIAAGGEGCVIVGRCADYILYQEPRSFRVFLHARPQWRAQQLAERKGISLSRASDELERTDAARARYYQNFTGRKWGDTRWFHLTVDTEVFDREQCVALILEGLKLRGEV
ncbi:MAG: cytidylate kinase family protein [Oscillospiraceae bacterium]|nr:cytidylate kinase family protein [Oscillospiraceae bacterium]